MSCCEGAPPLQFWENRGTNVLAKWGEGGLFENFATSAVDLSGEEMVRAVLAILPRAVYAITGMNLITLSLAVVLLPLALLATVRADVAAVSVMNCTFKLFNHDSTATCFLLHDEKDPKRIFLVTAAHVLEKATGNEAILVLRERKADGTYVRKDVPVKIREGEKALWTKHKEEDISVMLLKVKEGIKLPSLPTSVLAREGDLKDEEFTVCSKVWMFGYPARMEANGAGFPIARNGSIASYPLVPVEPHRTFMADCSTYAGDSGGPVFITRQKGESAGQPLLVGMVVAQYRNDEKLKMLHEERLIRHRLSLGKVVQAEFIRQTIAGVK